MTSRFGDGAGLLGALRAAVDNLAEHVDEVNALNVFPVPDGDTRQQHAGHGPGALAEAEAVADQPASRIASASASAPSWGHAATPG